MDNYLSYSLYNILTVSANPIVNFSYNPKNVRDIVSFDKDKTESSTLDGGYFRKILST